VLYVKAIEENNSLLFTISNPHNVLLNIEFVQMFRRGWTTKATGGHGYGLFNVRNAIERCHGKIVARNETIDETQYITVGVLVS
jgi:two-component system sensor histidine kinase AgrC